MSNEGIVLLLGALLIAGMMTCVMSVAGIGPWEFACWLELACPP